MERLVHRRRLLDDEAQRRGGSSGDPRQRPREEGGRVGAVPSFGRH